MNLCFFGLYTMSPFSVQFPPTLLITQACVEESSACRCCMGLSTQALLPPMAHPPPPPPLSMPLSLRPRCPRGFSCRHRSLHLSSSEGPVLLSIASSVLFLCLFFVKSDSFDSTPECTSNRNACCCPLKWTRTEGTRRSSWGLFRLISKEIFSSFIF